MTIIGPPDRKPDALGDGFEWCACGLHPFPARLAFRIATVHTACPLCAPESYVGKQSGRKSVAHTVTWMTDDSQRMPREAS